MTSGHTQAAQQHRRLTVLVIAQLNWSQYESRQNAAPMQKTKGATDCSVAPWLVPSPRYFAGQTLLQGRVGRAGSRAARHRGSNCGEANHCIFVRAEATHTGLVNRRRDTIQGVARDDTVQSGSWCIAEVVTALRLTSGAGLGHNPINQASVGRSRCGATGRGARPKGRDGRSNSRPSGRWTGT